MTSSDLSLSNKISKLTVSNTFLKSIKTDKIISPFSINAFIKSRKCCITWTLEWLFLKKLRYILPVFSSVEQCRSVGWTLFNNSDSSELGYQTPKYLMPLDLVLIKSNTLLKYFFHIKTLKLRLKKSNKKF